MSTNKYGLPEDELKRIRARDKNCVYCHKLMVNPNAGGSRSDWATIEHLNYLPPWNKPETVVICCWSCNSSRGNRKIVDWFKMPYCLDKKINENTVTEPIRRYIRCTEK